MKVLDEQHEDCGKPKTKSFGQVRKGDVFEHGGRILMKIETFWYVSNRHDDDRDCPPLVFLKTNAIRLKGNPASYDDGRMSRFEDNTAVTPRDHAVLYLKG